MNKNELLELLDKKIIYLSILGWLGIGLFLVLFIIFKKSPHDATVTYDYWDASYNWIIGKAIYQTGASGGFVYFPQSAILQIPFALLPARFAQVLWTMLNVSLLALSCFYIVKLSKNVPKNIFFFFVSLITIPLSYDSLRNGQMNILLTVLAVFIAYNIARKRYKTCIILCLLGIALKPYMIILFLLVVGLHPKRYVLPAIAGLIILFLFPFITQAPAYVLGEYKAMLGVLAAGQKMGYDIPWTNFFGTLKLFGANISPIWIYVVSVVTGVGIYICSLRFFRKEDVTGPILTMTLGIVFILLFAGKAELNTYCMIGPFMGFFMFMALYTKTSKQKWVYFFVSLVLWFFIFGAHAVSGVIIPSLKSINCQWTAPIAFIIFIAYTFILVISKIKTKDFDQKYFISA